MITDNMEDLLGLGIGLGVIGLTMNMMFGAQNPPKKVKYCKKCKTWVPLTHKHTLIIKK